MNKKIKAITLAAIFASLYVCITIISVYVFPILSVLSLLIMPIFSAYYSSVYNFKQTLLYNIVVLVLTFLCGIVDPLFPIFYVLPSLLIGDLFGLLNKLKVKYYTTIFLQTIAYSITNIFAIFLAEKIYEVDIVSFIISDTWILNNFSFTILFILSGAEAVFSSMFISEKLKMLSIEKKVEKEMPIFGYIGNVVLFFLSVLFFFINNNFYFLFICMNIIISIPIIKDLFVKITKKTYLLFITMITLCSLMYLLCYLKYYFMAPLAFTIILMIYSLVKIIIYIYNMNNKKEK